LKFLCSRRTPPAFLIEKIKERNNTMILGEDRQGDIEKYGNDNRRELRKLVSAEDLDYEKLSYLGVGIVPVISVCASRLYQNGLAGVLMQTYANKEAVARTLVEKKVWSWSRTRGGLWMKGESSGNVLELVGAYTDCDADSLLLDVIPRGPACHTGSPSCFTSPNSGGKLNASI
jgi:phosphoribosyl-AMP cyclohydrolase